MIDWIVSLASLLVSIVAIVISIQQTRLSNKQQLFEKRAAKYVEISELLNNYWNIQDSLNQKMILKSSTRVIDCLLSPLRATSEDKLSTIIDLCHRLKQSAVEISLLWKDRKFSHVEEFLISIQSSSQAFLIMIFAASWQKEARQDKLQMK